MIDSVYGFHHDAQYLIYAPLFLVCFLLRRFALAVVFLILFLGVKEDAAFFGMAFDATLALFDLPWGGTLSGFRLPDTLAQRTHQHTGEPMAPTGRGGLCPSADPVRTARPVAAARCLGERKYGALGPPVATCFGCRRGSCVADGRSFLLGDSLE